MKKNAVTLLKSLLAFYVCAGILLCSPLTTYGQTIECGPNPTTPVGLYIDLIQVSWTGADGDGFTANEVDPRILITPTTNSSVIDRDLCSTSRYDDCSTAGTGSSGNIGGAGCYGQSSISGTPLSTNLNAYPGRQTTDYVGIYASTTFPTASNATNLCLSSSGTDVTLPTSIPFAVELWEEDGCGGDCTFDTGSLCNDDADHRTQTNVTLNLAAALADPCNPGTATVGPLTANQQGSANWTLTFQPTVVVPTPPTPIPDQTEFPIVAGTHTATYCPDEPVIDLDIETGYGGTYNWYFVTGGTQVLQQTSDTQTNFDVGDVANPVTIPKVAGEWVCGTYEFFVEAENICGNQSPRERIVISISPTVCPGACGDNGAWD